MQTSAVEKGQIYVPKINFIIAIGTLLLVLLFQNSQHWRRLRYCSQYGDDYCRYTGDDVCLPTLALVDRQNSTGFFRI